MSKAPPMTAKAANQLGLFALHGSITNLSWYRPSDDPYRDIHRWIVAHCGLDLRHRCGRAVVVELGNDPPRRHSMCVSVGRGWLTEQLEQYHSPQTRGNDCEQPETNDL